MSSCEHASLTCFAPLPRRVVRIEAPHSPDALFRGNFARAALDLFCGMGASGWHSSLAHLKSARSQHRSAPVSENVPSDDALVPECECVLILSILAYRKSENTVWGVGGASRNIRMRGVAQHANREYIAPSTICTATSSDHATESRSRISMRIGVKQLFV